MKRATVLDIIVTLIIMMFLYASFSKYFDYGAFSRGMHSQPFPDWINSVLIIILPPTEILIAVLLFREKTRRTGLLATLVILSIFSIYVIAILLKLFPNVPCPCGGIVRMLNWPRHLIFNLFFLTITIIGLHIQTKERKNPFNSVRINP